MTIRTRIGVLVAVATAAVTLLTASPGAADGPPLGYQEIDVAGSLSANGTWDVGSGATIRNNLTGDVEWTGVGAGTVSLEFYVILGPQPYAVTGTASFTSGEGTATASVTGWLDFRTDPNLTLALAVSVGTGRFAGVTGRLDMVGKLVPTGVPGSPESLEATIDGSLTLPGTTPTSRADCRNGGWRSHVDDQGRPFHSRGHCTAFVDRLGRP